MPAGKRHIMVLVSLGVLEAFLCVGGGNGASVGHCSHPALLELQHTDVMKCFITTLAARESSSQHR